MIPQAHTGFAASVCHSTACSSGSITAGMKAKVIGLRQVNQVDPWVQAQELCTDMKLRKAQATSTNRGRDGPIAINQSHDTPNS